MKHRKSILALSLGAILAGASATAGAGVIYTEANPWPVWTPMYWMHEMLKVMEEDGRFIDANKLAAYQQYYRGYRNPYANSPYNRAAANPNYRSPYYNRAAVNPYTRAAAYPYTRSSYAYRPAPTYPSPTPYYDRALATSYYHPGNPSYRAPYYARPTYSRNAYYQSPYWRTAYAYNRGYNGYGRGYNRAYSGWNRRTAPTNNYRYNQNRQTRNIPWNFNQLPGMTGQSTPWDSMSTMNPAQTWNPANSFNPMNSMNPAQSFNPMNSMNPMNSLNPTQAWNPGNAFNPMNSINPMNSLGGGASPSLPWSNFGGNSGSSSFNPGRFFQKTSYRYR